MRWLFSIIVTLAFAASIYFFYQTWSDYHRQEAELMFLEKEQSQFQRLKREYAEQSEKVVLINSLWDEIASVGLTPADWVEYPLRINRTVPWPEFQRLLLLAGNHQADGGYWFMPERLRVSRVIPHDGPKEAGEGEEPQKIIVAQGDEPEPQEIQYDVSLQGKFMIPKR